MMMLLVACASSAPTAPTPAPEPDTVRPAVADPVARATYELRIPQAAELVANTRFSVILSFQNPTETVQEVANLRKDVQLVCTGTGDGEPVRLVHNLAWSMDGVRLEPGALAAVFGNSQLSSGTWTLTAEHPVLGPTNAIELTVP